MRLRPFFALAAVGSLAVVLLGACSSSSTSGGAPDASTASDSAIVSCANDPRAQTYAAGLTARGKGIVVSIASADPAPPARDLNNWVVGIGPATSAAIGPGPLSVETFMPDHGHTSTVKPTVTQQPDGRYKVENLDFFMGGVWRVRFVWGAQSDGGPPPDTADFFFCIEG